MCPCKHLCVLRGLSCAVPVNTALALRAILPVFTPRDPCALCRRSTSCHVTWAERSSGPSRWTTFVARAGTGTTRCSPRSTQVRDSLPVPGGHFRYEKHGCTVWVVILSLNFRCRCPVDNDFRLNSRSLAGEWVALVTRRNVDTWRGGVVRVPPRKGPCSSLSTQCR